MNKPFHQIFLVDDHALTRRGVRDLIDRHFPEMRVVGEAGSVREFQQLLIHHHPDLVILDVILQDGNGIDVVNFIRSHRLETSIVVLTQSENQKILHQLAKLKVDAIIAKSSPDHLLIEALQVLAVGGRKSATAVSGAALRKRESVKPAGLTEKELVILKLVIAGNTTREIAAMVGCSVETIKTHRANILAKTGTRNAVELSAWTLRSPLRDGVMEGSMVDGFRYHAKIIE
jgi:DNA-binding NarL/FixJ family response regulator